jgi:hypothetical protein
MDTATLIELSVYIAALSDALLATRRAEGRTRYRDHLASAAVIFEALHRGDWRTAKDIIGSERRSYGWDFLDGECGANAETQFARFARFIESRSEELSGT